MKPSRLLILVTMLAFLAACSASARTKTLRAGLVSLNVAYDTTLAVSKEREAQIIKETVSSGLARGLTKEQARTELAAALAAWRAKVDKAEAALEVGYRAIYAASILDDAKSLVDATAAVAQVIAIVAALKPPDKPAPPKEASP